MAASTRDLDGGRLTTEFGLNARLEIRQVQRHVLRADAPLADLHRPALAAERLEARENGRHFGCGHRKRDLCLRNTKAPISSARGTRAAARQEMCWPLRLPLDC